MRQARSRDHNEPRWPGVCVHSGARDATREAVGGIKNFRRAWISACKVAGVPGRILHDFRRTAVRNQERAGIPRSSAMAMVGHKTESIYRRYAIVDAGVLRNGCEQDRSCRGHNSGHNEQTCRESSEANCVVCQESGGAEGQN